MNFQDEYLMAFVDGELDAATAHAIEAAVITDADLAKRVTRLKQMRELIGKTNEPAQPPPDHLLQMLCPSATVTDLAAARAIRSEKRTSPKPSAWWSAIAAGIVLAFVAGRTTARPPSLLSTNGAIIASGALDKALDGALAGSSGDLRLNISFRTKDGQVCRTFEMGAENQSGLACNSDKGWQVRALAMNEEPANGNFRQAGSSAPQILDLVDDLIEGEPFDAAEEKAAREKGWR